jgi:hypothetical protein
VSDIEFLSLNSIQKNELQFVSLSEVAQKIKDSETYHNLPKEKKREMTRDVIYEFFRTNSAYKNYYVETHYHIQLKDGNTTRIKSRNVLLGWKIRPIEIDEE